MKKINLTSLFTPDAADIKRRNMSFNRSAANLDAPQPIITSQVQPYSTIPQEGVLTLDEIRRRKQLRNQSHSLPDKKVIINQDDERRIKCTDSIFDSSRVTTQSVAVSSAEEDSSESPEGQVLTIEPIRKRKASKFDQRLSASNPKKIIISTVQPMALTIVILSLNQVRSRELFPDEMEIGILYKKQTSRMLKNLSMSMSDEVAVKLSLDADREFNVETTCALENMKTLVRRGEYPLITKDVAYHAIECIKQFRHAQSHNDVIYLLLHMRISLSAVVLMTSIKMLGDGRIMDEALGKLESLGGACPLPKVVPICERIE